LLPAHHGRKRTIMKLLYTTILACMLAGALTAQNTITLNWIVTDEDYEPIDGVHVYMKYVGRGTISDDQGRISLDVKIGDEIILSRQGFETAFKVDKSTQKDSILILAIEPILLPEILISAYSTNWRTNIHCDCYYDQETTSLSPVKKQALVAPKLVGALVSSTNIHSYPNPTNSFLNLQSEKPLGQIDLFNLSGQKLKTYNFQQQFQAEIDLSGQPKGTYVLRSSEGWVERVLKQ
jgi:co-chaperonin GroES (HSP10)